MSIGNVIDISGQRFGAWSVISCAGRNKSGGAMWLCQCDCGTVRRVDGRSLRVGASTSCGCLSKWNAIEAAKRYTTKHGGKNERLYNVWSGIKDRCRNTKSKYYDLYGGRGVTLCDEWNDYAVFRSWALKNGYDPNAEHGKCTIDRIDNNGGYNPENCRWVDQRAQGNNRRTNHVVEFDGRARTITEWSRETGIPKDTLRRRLVIYGWPVDRALTEQVHRKRHNNS